MGLLCSQGWGDPEECPQGENMMLRLTKMVEMAYGYGVHDTYYVYRLRGGVVPFEEIETGFGVAGEFCIIRGEEGLVFGA